LSATATRPVKLQYFKTISQHLSVNVSVRVRDRGETLKSNFEFFNGIVMNIFVVTCSFYKTDSICLISLSPGLDAVSTILGIGPVPTPPPPPPPSIATLCPGPMVIPASSSSSSSSIGVSASASPTGCSSSDGRFRHGAMKLVTAEIAKNKPPT
jgi:hypothetical protein